MAIGDDGIQLDLPAAAAATDGLVAIGTQWDAALAGPVKSFVDELISTAPWGHDEDGLKFQNIVVPGLQSLAEGVTSIGPIYTKMGTDARAALTERFPELDQDGSQRLRQL